jgi:penicillin-binding protein 1C
MKRVMRDIRWLGLVCLAGAGAGALACWSVPAAFVPGFERVKAAHISSEALLLDRHGEVIHELRIDSSGRRLDWVPLEDISPALPAAILQAEDHRFYSHKGVDWSSLVGSVRGLFNSSRSRGASTITMQLASRLSPELQPRSGRRTYRQKLKQIRTALQIERRWSKTQILEAYLNLVTFRGEVEGIAAAASGIFGKRPHGLDDVESLILAALVRSPNAPAEQIAARTAALARIMGRSIDRAELSARTTEALARIYFVRPQASLAPHVARQVLLTSARRAGEQVRIVCTLDASLQRFAAESLRHQLSRLRSQNVHDGAVLVVDNATGEVLAYVGNDGDLASARYVDGVQAPRQAGSTLKPFVYGIAFERRLLTPVSLLDDSPLDVPVGGGIYRPRNYDNRFHGVVTSRVALASSLNVPAVKVLTLTGVDTVVGRLGELGFENLRSADFYGPSLALGAVDITLWDLVNAYRTLANDGISGPLRLAPDLKDCGTHRVFSRESAFLLKDILSDRESRSVTFSLESPLATRFWTAVKTGTSKDMRDNWCVGFSNRYTVGVWTGNFSGEPMWDVSGVTGAAPVWVEVMNWLQRGESSKPPVPPPGVVQCRVQLAGSGRILSEWFVRGTETDLAQPAILRTGARISYPANGTIVALDPDIPWDDQKVPFEAGSAADPIRWALDGEELGPARLVLLWTPLKGKHTLSLLDANGRALDTVTFEVRGNLAVADGPEE